jgi:hypothetical protein
VTHTQRYEDGVLIDTKDPTGKVLLYDVGKKEYTSTNTLVLGEGINMLYWCARSLQVGAVVSEWGNMGIEDRGFCGCIRHNLEGIPMPNFQLGQNIILSPAHGGIWNLAPASALAITDPHSVWVADQVLHETKSADIVNRGESNYFCTPKILLPQHFLSPLTLSQQSWLEAICTRLGGKRWRRFYDTKRRLSARIPDNVQQMNYYHLVDLEDPTVWDLHSHRRVTTC